MQQQEVHLGGTWVVQVADVPVATKKVVKGPGVEDGPRRGLLSVQCRYKPGWEAYVKYWCKGPQWSSCAIQVKTNGDEEEKKEGRFSIKDDQCRRIFTVTMENLWESDAGSYWCGIERTGKDLKDGVWVTVGPDVAKPLMPEDVSFQDLPAPLPSWSPRVFKLPVGGTLVMQCQYRAGEEASRKFWCRGARWSNCVQVFATAHVGAQAVRHGRVTLRDSPQERMLFVTMEQLEEGDAGHLCLKGPGSVTGTTGGSVNVQCQYEEVYKGYNKYWCRGKYDTACNKIVETEGEAKEKRNGRVTIRDHAENLTLTVTMENLNADDAGSYWCRIQTVWILDVLSYDPSVNVNVSVWPGCVTLSGPRVVMGTEGGPLSVQCRYAEKYKDNDKYWCREPSVRPCDKIVRTSKSEREKQRGRVSIRDDPAQLSFTVTMTHLTAEDEGVYWCGIFVTLISDPKLLDPTFPVAVLVFPGCSTMRGPSAVTGREGGSLTVKCDYDPGYEKYVKWWCRGAAWGPCRILVKTTGSEQEVKNDRISIKDCQEDRTFTVIMELLRKDDADVYWCGIEKTGTDLGAKVKVSVDPEDRE
ncbi:polymeric immunoglobulin receptor-like [Rhynchocyon petersi]